MTFWQKLLFAIAFFTDVDMQLQAAKMTPVGGTATLDLSSAGQALEISEGGQHWVPVTQVWKRLK